MIRFLTNRWVHFFLLLALVGAAVFYSPSEHRWRKEMQFLVFDSLNRVFPREKTDQIIIVDIDDDSLKEIGQWPWPRTEIAKLVANLTALGAKVIAFDGLLAEPDRSSPRFILDRLPEGERYAAMRGEIEALEDHDEVLARAIKDSGIFVSAFTFSTYTQTPTKPRIVKQFLMKKADKQGFLDYSSPFKKAAVFLPGLEKAAAGNGSFMAHPDADGVLRQTGVVFSDGKNLYPSLGLEALRVSTGNKKIFPKIRKLSFDESKNIDTKYRIGVGAYDVPVERDGLVWMHYRVFDELGDDYLSAYKVIDAAHHEGVGARIKDKVVLIGSSAEGLKDLRSTALEPFQPGVEIHANAIEQFLQGKYLLRPQVIDGVEVLFILVSGLLMVVLVPFVHVMVMALLCVALIGLAFMGSILAYVDYSILLDPFYASLCVFSIFVTSTLLTYLRVESERSQVRGAFGLYISPDFMKELTKNPDKLKLGGETRELTVMFSDIRRFTSICEGLSPEEIIQLMNDFLTPMSDLVMQNRGTIDKYMGDAMMAFWNAPLDDEDHARNACVTALGMQAALAPINERVKERAEKEGKDPVLLKAGIGINTGPCAVGNMGSRQRFAYSTLGDAVNLASRLESQTKNYSVDILLGEATKGQVEDFAALELDLIQVMGKSKPVRIYTLIGDDGYASTEEFKKWESKHESMIKNYREQNFDEVFKLVGECKKLSGGRLKTTYEMYGGRINELIKSPPGEGWDGVYIAKEK